MASTALTPEGVGQSQVGGRPRPDRSTLLLALAVVLGIVAGTGLVVAPLPAIGAVAGIVILVALATLGGRSAQAFVVALGILLTAYAFLGRGIAYVGTGSAFIGEGVLFLGIVAFALNLGRVRFGLVEWLIVAFMVVGLTRTLPFLGTYGVTALRDGVVWGYAAFALILVTTFDARWFGALVRAYRAISPAFLVWVPAATALTVALGDSLPHWPGAPVPLVVVKQGDFAVQLAGITAFILVGLFATRRERVPSWVIWTLLFVDVAIVAAVSRGGLVSAVLGAGCALLFVRSGQRVFSAMGIGLAGLVLLYALNPSVNVGSSQGRMLSFSQLVDNVTSVLSPSEAGNLEGTKAWRLAWWNTIIDYTIDGQYFWSGKGFGVNLADADGFQVLADRSLRQPHNGHIALLARGGVPLFALWILLNGAFGVGIVRAALRAKGKGDLLVVRLAGVVAALWVAALLNMSFDVYLEGPQGGIWFWSVVGLGLALIRRASAAGGPVVAEATLIEPEWTGARARRFIPAGRRAGVAAPTAGPSAAPATPAEAATTAVAEQLSLPVNDEAAAAVDMAVGPASAPATPDEPVSPAKRVRRPRAAVDVAVGPVAAVDMAVGPEEAPPIAPDAPVSPAKRVRRPRAAGGADGAGSPPGTAG